MALLISVSSSSGASTYRVGGKSAGDGTPVSGGTLTYLVDQSQTTLDPAVSPADVTALIDRNIFDSLVVQTAPSAFKPWLATSWQISPDGLNYTFDLKTGVKFTDGCGRCRNSPAGSSRNSPPDSGMQFS
jgi:peptide/nickel transport system substrate-binding protein